MGDNGNVVMLGGHGHGYDVTMFDFEIEEWVKLANLTFYSDRHSCVILPKNQENTEDRILIVSQYKTAYIYNIQRGTTSIAGTMNQKRGFSQVVKINSKIYVVGGDYHTQLVEAYDE